MRRPVAAALTLSACLLGAPAWRAAAAGEPPPARRATPAESAPTGTPGDSTRATPAGAGIAATAAGTGTVAPVLSHAHRHRLVGLASKAAMMHGSVLYHESGPGMSLDRGLARQHAEEMARLVRSQIANLLALEREPAESEEVARANAEMTRVAGVVRGQADSLLAALATAGAGQAEIRRRAQRIFHLERRVLQLHQAVEAVIGVKPPPDPPAPEADSTSHR